jgi:hypothetical protein
MKTPSNPLAPERRALLQAELRRDIVARQDGYREKALRILPHVAQAAPAVFETANASKSGPTT